MSSARRAEDKPILIAKAPKNSEFAFLKRQPQAEIPGFPLEAPSVLHFTQLRTG